MQSAKVPEPVDINALIHPDLKEAIAKMPLPDKTRTLQQRRQLMSQFYALVHNTQYETVETTTKQIPGPKDAPEVRVKIYKPKTDDCQRPGLLWIHGGGYIVGNADENDSFCQRFVHDVDCVVVNVDYRLAPENTYPAAIEDCYTALVWMRDSAQELNIDTKRIAVAGGSAGGGLCAALTLMARDRGGPAICFQMPLYPMIDHRSELPSTHEIVDGRFWNRDANIAGWGFYLGDHAKGEVSPYAAPSRATDYAGLPPTFTYIGSLDVFRDETIEYVQKLLQAKVPVEFHIYPGCFHGFEVFVPQAKVSQEAASSIFTALKKAFSS